MNKSDSERLAAVLENLGYQKTNDEKSADLIAIVACSVRQSAVDRIYSLLNQKSKIKGQNDKLKCKIILTGCLMPKDEKVLRNRVDLIINIKDMGKLPQLLGIKNYELRIKDYLNIKAKYSNSFSAYIPISTGCDNYCSYCVVPYVRGPETSRPAEEIINEVKCLIKKGYKEITLVGQNVNSYHGKIKNQKSKVKMTNQKSKIINFPELLKMIDNLPGNFWLRFISSHPKDLSDDLIKVMARGQKICPYLHLPVQSGDDQILKSMNRHYTAAHYKTLIKKIRSKFARIRKDICISTDIIVGFPGETKKQFNNTANLMKRVNFDMAYIAEYSPRPGTAAAKLKDNVPHQEKERRRKLLTEILKKSALKNNKKYLGKTVEVLIEESRIMNNESRMFFGKTKTYKNVKVHNSKFIIHNSDLVGQFVKVKITKAADFGLKGVSFK